MPMTRKLPDPGHKVSQSGIVLKSTLQLNDDYRQASAVVP